MAGQQLLYKLLALFDAEGRYRVLTRLQMDCPYSNVGSHLILTWKKEFLNALSAEDTRSPFLQPRLLEVFFITLTVHVTSANFDCLIFWQGNASDLIGRLDLVITAFNFLLVVLIKTCACFSGLG